MIGSSRQGALPQAQVFVKADDENAELFERVGPPEAPLDELLVGGQDAQGPKEPTVPEFALHHVSSGTTSDKQLSIHTPDILAAAGSVATVEFVRAEFVLSASKT